MPIFKAAHGTDIHYEIFGQDNRPVVILLHGLASSSEIWKPQIVELKEHFRVIAFDLPGHGKSGWQDAPYDIQDVPTVVADLMTHENIEEAHLMGLSIGGTAAVLFAAEYPERVISLVLEGPPAGMYPYSHPLGMLELVQLYLTLHAVFLMWKVVGRKIGGKVINWFGKTYQFSAMLTGMEEVVDQRAMKGYSYSNGNNPFGTRLPQVKAPVLIVRGLEDQFPRRSSEAIKAQVSGSCYWFEIPLAQHLVALEKPMEFNLIITAFLAKVQKADVLDVVDAANVWKTKQRVRSRYS